MPKPISTAAELHELRAKIQAGASNLAAQAAKLTEETIRNSVGDQVKTAALHGSGVIKLSMDFTVDYLTGQVTGQAWIAAAPPQLRRL